MDEHHEWFRYHQPFQSLPFRRMQHQCRPDEIDALHTRAARWFAREDLIKEALHHYLAAKLISDQRHTILRAFLDYIAGDGDGTARHARQSLESIAPEAYSVRSWSQLMLAVGYPMRGELVRAYQVLAKAFETDIPPGTTYHERLSLALCFIRWIGADLSGLHQSATQALKLCREFDLPDAIGIATYFMDTYHDLG